MTWREIEVIGHPTRSAIEHCSRTPGAHVEMQVESDVLPPHTENLADMWFLVVSITSIDTTADTELIDSPDEPMTSICFTGTISGTDIPVQIIFFQEMLDRFLVDIG